MRLYAWSCVTLLCDTQKQPGRSGVETLSILVPCVILPLAIALLFFFICTCRNAQKAQRSPVPRQPKPVRGQNVEMSMLSACKPKSKAKELPLSAVRFMEELGECTFGRVYRGHLYLPGMEQAQLVAIKTLKNPSSPQMWGEFQQEVSLLAELHHHNVATLLGVVTQDMPVCMLLEFLRQGDLRQFLISCSLHSDVGGASSSKEGGTAHFMLKDLATRNVLVVERMHLKISVLGHLHLRLPLRPQPAPAESAGCPWKPSPAAPSPPTPTSGRSAWCCGRSSASTCGFSSQEVVDVVHQLQLLACPPSCPACLYGLMVGCWREGPAQRPRFRDIHSHLT